MCPDCTSAKEGAMIVGKLRKARSRLAEGGLVATARWAFASVFYHPITQWLDNRFDRRYGTDTTQYLHRSDFDLDAEVADHARNYGASPDRTFLRFLRQQQLDYSDYTFIDLGCGKGRTLLLASQFPFKKIVGVEVEPAIHATCLRNIAIRFADSKVSQRPVEALCMSAGDYDFPDGNILLYLFNPFDEYIMRQVAQKLRRAVESTSRFIRIVYFHPNHVKPLLALPKINLISEETFRCRASVNKLGRMASYEIAP